MRTPGVIVRSRGGAPIRRSGGPMAMSRTIGVLEALSSGLETPTLSQLGRMLAIPKSSVAELLWELEALQLICRDEAGRYRQGARAYRLGLQLLSPPSLAATIRQAVTTAGSSLGMTVTFGRLDRPTRSLIYIDRWELPEPVKFVLSLGQPLELHCRAIGKLLLAHEPRASWPQWLGPEPYRAMTEATITGSQALARELIAIRRQGQAWSAGESFPGVASLALPVKGVDGKVVGSLGAQAPVARLSKARERVATRLQASAADLSNEMCRRGITAEGLPTHV